jgi:acetyl esterase/lipase
MRRMLTRPAAALAIAIALGPLPASAQGRPPEIRVTTHLDYVPTAEYEGWKDRLDVYAPADARDAPVVVSIHGGALREGDKYQEGFVGQRLAQAGFVAVVINYRLSPAVMHPAHVEDAARAVAWARTNAAQHGGNPRRLFVIGHSAGAYLAALLATDPRYLAPYQMKPTDLAGIVPVSAFFYVDRAGVAPDRPKDVWGTDPAAWKAASPAAYLGRDVPPMLLLYADGDQPWRRQQQADFVADLSKAGGPAVEARMIAGRDHTTVWTRMKNPGDEVAAAIVAFVKAH